jgi:hypothetical protein
MKIGIGMIGRSPAWEELLLQEGISWDHEGPEGHSDEVWSILLLTRHPSPAEWDFVRDNLRRGSALLSTTAAMRDVDPAVSSGVGARVSYLVPGGHGAIGGVGLVDVEARVEFPREANAFLTDDGVFAVSLGEYLGAPAAILPFDPAAAYQDFRACERYFYAGIERLPSERVSRTGKGEILHLLHTVLGHLHRVRNLPYVSLSPFPAGSSSVFSFRIDTDGGSRAEINELEAIAREFSIGFTWFLDAGSHAAWLSRFVGMPGHEIGLHCHQHRVYLDARKDRDNIRQGRSLMEKAGLPVAAFAAPFGFWSHELGRIIDEEGFAYSSEFSWAYDALPGYPVDERKRFRTLQVPVHPVSIGSLRKSGFSSDQMIEYYRAVIDRKLRRGEPLIFYSHPGHQTWDVIRDLCRQALRGNVRPMTMGAYAEWWLNRRNVKFNVRTTEGGVQVEVQKGSDTGAMQLVVEHPSGEVLVPVARTIRLADISWQKKRLFLPPDDIRRIREFDLRGEIGRQFTRIQRRFL